jgi:hypothetical protein
MRRHFSYANIVATLALVFAMSGGAMAANHYLINSTRQISPKVLKKLKGKTGKTGRTGRTGAAGAAGPAGPAGAPGENRVSAPGPRGAEGKEGPPGPEGLSGNDRLAESYAQFGAPSPAIALSGTGHGVMVLSSHSSGEGRSLWLIDSALVLVQATVQVRVEAGPAEVTCQLADDGLGERQAAEPTFYGQSATVSVPAGSTFAEVPLTGASRLAGQEEYDLRVYCERSSGATVSATGGSLNAVGYENELDYDASTLHASTRDGAPPTP